MLRTLPVENPADAPDPRPVPTERVPVAFAGDGSGTGPMTWGQTEIWLTMTQKGWIGLGGVLPLAPGTTVASVAGELRFMLSRFPSMRTRLAFDGEGLPSQVLSASGEAVVEVYDAEGQDDADAAALVAAVDAHYRTRPRDFENEWPVRMAVIRRDGVLTHMVVYSCHLVTDGGGAQIIARDMAARDLAAEGSAGWGAASGSEPPTGTEQLDLALWQRSEAGLRQSAGSLRYWEKTLQTLEPRPFPASGDRREPRHWTGELDSPALYLAVQSISARTRASSKAVLLALYATALGRHGVLNPAVVRPQASNRFRRGLAGMVANLVQTGLCVIDTADSTVDQVVARAKRETMAAYKNAYHDPSELAALLDRDAERRGPGAAPWDVYSWAFLNDRRDDDRRDDGRDGDAEPPTAEQLELALARTEFRWAMKKHNPFEPLYLHINGTEDSIVLILNADTDRLAPAVIEGLVRDIEAIAVAAAFDPGVPTGV